MKPIDKLIPHIHSDDEAKAEADKLFNQLGPSGRQAMQELLVLRHKSLLSLCRHGRLDQFMKYQGAMEEIERLIEDLET